MNATQTKSFQPDSMTHAGQSHLAAALHDRPAERQAVIGGGTITTPSVAAHLRRKMAETGLGAPAERRAVIGGGTITTPSVAAHLRRKMAATGQRSI